MCGREDVSGRPERLFSRRLPDGVVGSPGARSALNKSWTLLACAFFAGALGGCQGGTPPAKADYQAEHGLVESAISRAENAPPGQADAELLRLLKELQGQIAESERRHVQDQQKIKDLTEEAENLRQAAGFAVHHIEILYFTHVTDKGVDLWVTPFDRHNDVVKTAGSFRVSLHEADSWGLRKLGRKLCAWEMSAKEVETRWEGQLFEGYHLKLDWPEGKAPEAKTAVLAVEFTTAEAKTYSATKELTLQE